MRKINILICFFATALFTGCFKDECKSVRQIYKPVYKTLSQVRSNIKARPAEDVKNAGKIYLYKNYIFLNEPGNGIHVIDNSDPSHPKNISFINIPGNVDLAVKDDYLYADSYSDLVVFNIADPANATVKAFTNNVFPSQNIYYNSSANTNPDDVLVPVDYITVDSLMDCETYSTLPMYDYLAAPNASAYYASAPSKAGIGGSTARFTVLNDYLYTVDYTSLYTFDAKNAADPQRLNSQIIPNTSGFIETIYPFENNLFIGSNSGMFIYDATNAAAPALTGQFGHVRSCDPVIADGNNAFVTLRSGSSCAGFTNQLEVLDIAKDITNPMLLKTYSLTNPRGLAKEGDLLFICDGPAGLKVYDASDINNLFLRQNLGNFEPNDVIIYNKLAIVTAVDGVYQYDYSDAADLKLLSKIPISN